MHSLTSTSNRPKTPVEVKLFEALKTAHKTAVANIKTTPDDSALTLSALATHQYIEQKLAAFEKHRVIFNEKKLSFALQLLDIIERRRKNKAHYQLEALKRDSSEPPYFQTPRTFEWHINNLIDAHSHECRLQGTQPGKFGLLLQWVRDGKMTTARMPSIHEHINDHNIPGIRAYFTDEKQKTEKYTYFQRRWLNQLSETHKKPVEYYQAWSDSNPYQHATSLALNQSWKWALGMVVLVIAVNLILAATTGGVGNLVALAGAYAAISSTPGAYGILSVGTGAVSALTSYHYHKTQYAFKQQAIIDCIASEPTTEPDTQTPDKSMG